MFMRPPYDRSMYVCILESEGEVVFHRDSKIRPDELKTAIAFFLDDLVFAVECLFSWYWLSGFCEDNNITFFCSFHLIFQQLLCKAVQFRISQSRDLFLYGT